jgi:hypothetical protein
MEPVAGFEPATDGLQNRCSTTELNWRKNGTNPALLIFAESASKASRFAAPVNLPLLLAHILRSWLVEE